ncbi:hypothetical protein XENTR_v10010069 [Xenopus tropicalis]|nr:hypothetical protein XENTR_v10010069 [Xenopus tropicalis]
MGARHSPIGSPTIALGAKICCLCAPAVALEDRKYPLCPYGTLRCHNHPSVPLGYRNCPAVPLGCKNLPSVCPHCTLTPGREHHFAPL